MHLKRDRIIHQQIANNLKSPYYIPPNQTVIQLLESRAHQQLTLPKITSREIDYSHIHTFLLLATQQQRNAFYAKIRQDLAAIFRDEHAQKTFETKWTHSLKHNVMACFTKIAKDTYNNPSPTEMLPLYVDAIDRLLTHEKSSRIEQKFLEPFLVESVRLIRPFEDIVGRANYQKLRKSGMSLSRILGDRETPKSITSNQFLKYCAMRILGVGLPHEKYLHNQLLHAPNPKYLFPLRSKGTFLALTNELLLKSNKLDLVACQFWNYFQYEEGDSYQRIRRAAQWGGRVDVLLFLIRKKLIRGLEKCLNHINQKVFYFSTKHLTEEGLNSLMALAQTAIHICNNRSTEEALFQTALEKVDIGQLFQHNILLREPRLRPFVVVLLRLYLILLNLCPKNALKLKFIPHLALQVTRLLQSQNDQKFTNQVIEAVLQGVKKLQEDERAEFMYGIVDTATHDWQSKQQLLLGHEIALISVHGVKLLGEMVGVFGFGDLGRVDFKVLKLQFYYVLALNYKENAYFESKQKLSRVQLDISPSLTTNSIFGVLQTRKVFHQAFRAHLSSLYGEAILNLSKTEHEGLLAVIDEVVTYRIQQTKTLASEDYHNTHAIHELCNNELKPRFLAHMNSFYGLLVNLLEQVERLQPTGKLLKIVTDYFYKCIKTYLIEVDTLKGRDETRTQARRLITRDASYLVEGCVSANPNLALFCWTVLQDYLSRVPELAIYTEVLVVWAECISILYRKSNQQYESKSQRLRGKYLSSGTPIPTERKQIFKRINVLMKGLYRVVLRGHMIDSDYLGVRVQYLIRENCKSASFGFGWKFLKHIINSFKEDKQFISKEVLTNNSCSWFVNEEYFNKQLDKIEPEKILLDKYLIPLHKQEIDKSQLKKILLAVEPQVETQFVTIPPRSSEGQAAKVVEEVGRLCLKIEQAESANQVREDIVQQLYSEVFDVISRVKMVYITKWNQALVFSQILHVCSRFVNCRLLEHILLKIVPFFYCLNEYNSKIVQTLGELLHFVVNQLNISCLKPLEQHNHIGSNTFDAPRNQLAVLVDYESKEPPAPGSRHKVVTNQQRRVNSLKSMYGELVRFFGSHIHVCIAKGFPLSLLLRVASISFLFEKTVLPELGLQSVCRCLLSQLQLVNVLKSALEKGQTAFDARVVDDFYVKTMKSALLHFQKADFGYDELVSSSFHNKTLKQRINFLIQICDYLRNDDFHQLSNKQLPKRSQLYAKRNQTGNPSRIDISLNRYQSKKIKPFMMEQIKPSIKYSEQRPLSGINLEVNLQSVNLTTLRYSLLYLISQQIDKIKAYAYPPLSQISNPYSLAGKKGYISNSLLEELLHFLTPRKGAKLIHNIIKIFGNRVEQPQILLRQLKQILSAQPIYNYPSFLPLYVQVHKNDPQKLRELNYWRSPHIPLLLQYLSKEYEAYPALQRYVTKVLAQLQADQILFYLPQIFQGLTLASGKIVFHFLLEYARKSSCFAHQLVWLAKVESKQEKDPHNKSPRLPGVDEHLNKLGQVAKLLIKRTVYQFNREEKAFFHEVDNFYEQVTAISGKMKPTMPAADKRDIIKEEAEKIRVPRSAYLPFNTNYQVISIKEDSGTPMQSAAKCPFLLTFNCQKYSGPDAYFAERKAKRLQTKFTEEYDDDLPQEEIVKPMQSMSIQGSRLNIMANESRTTIPLQNQSNFLELRAKKKLEEREISCIFKVFDDIRQDCLALQVIRLFLEIFERHSLDLKLFPYRTLSNRTGANLDIGGIIEVVPNCVSRDSIGKTNEESLYQFFLSNFGPEHNMVFQSARENFIRSQAAYSIVSYILQVKDRHNGNIMVDKQQGYLVHIDFGFILEISPANNLRFERAAFKLTDEMINIMGGSIHSEPFQLYLTLVIKGFLLARRYHTHIENMVSLMFQSGLPCFLPNAIINLRNRFFLDVSEIEAAQQMKDLVLSAADHWTTNWYDRIQWMQQKIYH